jgi:hypothetical protein
MVRGVGRLRLGLLPDEPASEQHIELCTGDAVTAFAFGDKHLQLGECTIRIATGRVTAAQSAGVDGRSTDDPVA